MQPKWGVQKDLAHSLSLALCLAPSLSRSELQFRNEVVACCLPVLAPVSLCVCVERILHTK